jgi:glyoxalase family protein
MNTEITGIHHVTAMSGGAQENIDFYTGILGMRLVKKTINFDMPDVYHFYYGDQAGSPGSIMTTFPYGQLAKGRHGKGFINTTTFSVPYASIDYWTARLKRFGINHKHPQERFQGEVVIYLEDPDGLGLELVFNDKDKRQGYTQGVVPAEAAIKGFHNVEIWADGYERTGAVLTQVLNHQLIIESGNRFRFAATDAPGSYVDIVATPESMAGRAGSGTVHHVAFATAGKESQLSVREKAVALGLSPTIVKDRQYFRSIYFREPGGVLFEVATADDSFAKDEPLEQLGTALKLPPWFEKDRQTIEQKLVPVSLQPDKFN